MREGTAVAGRYRLVEKIGAGGMGEVWGARDELLGRIVAVKVMLASTQDDPDFARRFLAEARAMASVHHPGVVSIHDFGETPDPYGGAMPYLVMEYVAGESLSGMLGRMRRLSPATTMYFVSQVAQALQAVHNHGIVHRDVKPANLIVRSDGTIALTDFGIAVGADSGRTQAGTVLGTPSYLAPEQVLGQPPTPRTDVYALGLVAYECLSGYKPFVSEDPFAAAIQRVHYPPAPLPPDVPPDIAGAVNRSLATDPERRWPTAAEFALAAERFLAAERSVEPAGGASPAVGVPAGRRPDTRTPAPDARPASSPDADGPATPRSHRPARRRRWLGAVVGATAAVLVAVVAVTVTLWVVRSPSQLGAAAGPPATTPSADAGSETGPPVPPGFVSCGQALCPTAPMCWQRLAQQGDRAFPPVREDCAIPHYWETFAATYIPQDATTDRDLTVLMERPDIRAICSDAAMGQRSLKPAYTKGWDREAWPVPVDSNTVLVHCLAGSPDGETPGAVFGPH